MVRSWERTISGFHSPVSLKLIHLETLVVAVVGVTSSPDAQFYIQLVYKPYYGTWILLFGPFGQLRVKKTFEGGFLNFWRAIFFFFNFLKNTVVSALKSCRAWVTWHLPNFWTVVSGTCGVWQFYYIRLFYTLEFWGFTSDRHLLFQIPNSSPELHNTYLFYKKNNK